MDASKSTSIFPIEGGCACGFARYRLEARPLVVHCCHCTSCQRETGTAFAINAMIESNYVTRLPSASPTIPASTTEAAKPASPPLISNIDDGAALEIIITPSESGKGQSIARCPVCRVAVWSHYAGAGPRVCFVRVGTLDEAWKVQPDVHIFTRSRRTFFKLDGSAPEFSAYYAREEVWSQESLARWEKLIRDGPEN